MMKRRLCLKYMACLPVASLLMNNAWAQDALGVDMEKVIKTDAEWRRILTPEAYEVLRHEATEAAFSSPLNHEHRQGVYTCAGCGLPLFASSKKFDSGTGWPSFFEAIAEHVATKHDFRMLLPRKEYHCARCGGHQGHVFTDGPEPTGLRWCNNGVALIFIPQVAQ